MKKKSVVDERPITPEEVQEYTALLFQVSKDVSIQAVLEKIKGAEVLSIERKEEGVVVAFFSYFEMFKIWSKIKKGVEIRKIQVIPSIVKSSFEKKKREALYLAYTAGGTRNLLLLEMEDFMAEDFIREEAEKFGEIMCLIYTKERRSCQIEFFSFASAMDFALALKEDTMLQNIRVSFIKSLSGAPESDIAAMNSRTVYIGATIGDTSSEEILRNIKGGPVFNVKILRDKRCAFITFFDYVSASAFIEYTAIFPLTIKGVSTKIGPGKSQPLPAIAPVLAYGGVTRCIVLDTGQADLAPRIERDMSEYGEIEKVEEVKHGMYHVYFLSIIDAHTAYKMVSQNMQWAGSLCGYAEDHCASENAFSLIMDIQKKEFLM